MSVWKLMLRVKRTFKTMTKESEYDLVLDCVTASGLVLDDLLAGARTDYGLSTLFAIICGRDEELRPTIVTSSKRLEEIHELDTGLASRLASFEVLKIDGPDRRLERRGR